MNLREHNADLERQAESQRLELLQVRQGEQSLHKARQGEQLSNFYTIMTVIVSHDVFNMLFCN